MKRIRKDGTVEEVNKGENHIRRATKWDWYNDGVFERREAKNRGLTVEELRASRERVERKRERKIRRNELKQKVVETILAPILCIMIIINWPFKWLKKKSTYYHQLALCYWSLMLGSVCIWIGILGYEKHGFNIGTVVMFLLAFSNITDFIYKRLKFRKLIMELVVQNFNTDKSEENL